MSKSYKKEEIILQSFIEISKEMKYKDKIKLLNEWMEEYSKKEEFSIAAILKKEKESLIKRRKNIFNKITNFIKDILKDY